MKIGNALPFLLASFITLAATKPASAQLFEEDWELRFGIGNKGILNVGYFMVF